MSNDTHMCGENYDGKLASCKNHKHESKAGCCGNHKHEGECGCGHNHAHEESCSKEGCGCNKTATDNNWTSTNLK